MLEHTYEETESDLSSVYNVEACCLREVWKGVSTLRQTTCLVYPFDQYNNSPATKEPFGTGLMTRYRVQMVANTSKHVLNKYEETIIDWR